jgi:hypothetical protein
MYLDVLNDYMVGFANITTRAMLYHLLMAYGNITAVDLENNFEHMRRVWDTQHPVESLFKLDQDCADYSEAGGVIIGHPQQINVGYAKIFATGNFMSASRWNEKPQAEKNVGTIQGPLLRRTPSAQTNTGGICRNIRLPLRKRHCKAD